MASKRTLKRRRQRHRPQGQAAKLMTPGWAVNEGLDTLKASLTVTRLINRLMP